MPAVPGGWFRAADGIGRGISGAAIPTTNGVWVTGADADPAAVARGLDDVSSAGVPYCLQARPGHEDALRELATSRGMTSDAAVPVMALVDGHALDGRDQVDGLRLRALAPHEAATHRDLLAAGFEVPAELVAPLASESVLSVPGVRAFVGEVDAVAVTTALAVRDGEHVGIFNVATPPHHRGRGYGAAITAFATLDAVSDGAAGAWLQSSAVGLSVYERLGFRTLEHWPCWVADA